MIGRLEFFKAIVRIMTFDNLTSISPIDGRYSDKTRKKLKCTRRMGDLGSYSGEDREERGRGLVTGFRRVCGEG